MIQFGAIPIKAIDAQKILSDKKFMAFNSDTYHYTRMIGDSPHEKIMIGNITHLPVKSLQELG